MAKGIESGAVPLRNGAIDLDGAYAFACAAHPQIREQLYTQRAAAERKSATDRANQARRAGASLSPSSPRQLQQRWQGQAQHRKNGA